MNPSIKHNILFSGLGQSTRTIYNNLHYSQVPQGTMERTEQGFTIMQPIMKKKRKRTRDAPNPEDAIYNKTVIVFGNCQFVKKFAYLLYY